MCFLKTLKPLDSITFDKETVTDEDSQQTHQKIPEQQNPYFGQLFTFQTLPLITKKDQLLLRLMGLVNSNNSYLQGLDHKLQQSEQRLNQSHQLLDQMAEQHSLLLPVSQLSTTSIDESSLDQEGSVVDPLLTHLFGKKKYLYKLQIQGQVPQIIYKERNINLSVNLVDQQSQKIMNSNMVHLCLGVCDANGQWITESKAGQSFMKGKTEVEMYHGEGSFLKVFPRDVSRNYAEGKVNFVIYSKPSLIQFSSSSSGVEMTVDSNLIEPLLIKDISIRAKKKE